MADLHSKILDARPPPGGPNSFNFMQFLGKFGKIVCWRPPPPGSLRPLLGEILDPPLNLIYSFRAQLAINSNKYNTQQGKVSRINQMSLQIEFMADFKQFFIIFVFPRRISLQYISVNTQWREMCNGLIHMNICLYISIFPFIKYRPNVDTSYVFIICVLKLSI